MAFSNDACDNIVDRNKLLTYIHGVSCCHSGGGGGAAAAVPDASVYLTGCSYIIFMLLHLLLLPLLVLLLVTR